jgi:TM2 domain-containing membrane protein YozV
MAPRRPEVNVLLAYVLWACGFLGFNGLHRFYMGRPVSGFIWLFTFGLAYIGQFVDLFLIPGMAKERNLYLWSRTRTDCSLDLVDLGRETLGNLTSPGTVSQDKPLSPLQQLLQAAESRNKALSLGQAVMITGLEPDDAQKLLMEAVRRGLAHVDNDPESGAVRYYFDV